MKYRPVNIAWNSFNAESMEYMDKAGMDNVPGLADIIKTSMEYAFYKGAYDTFDLILSSNKKVVNKEMTKDAYMELIRSMSKDLNESLNELAERIESEANQAMRKP